MKIKALTGLILILSFILVSGISVHPRHTCPIENQTYFDKGDYEKEWKKVDALAGKGLPKSALELVDEIYRKAKNEHNAPQIVKTILYQLRLKSEFEEEFLPGAIRDVELEIQSSEYPVKSILHSVLASLYWNYYENNRHVLLDRSITVSLKDDDITTWDLQKILQKTIDHYMASLSGSPELKKLPIGDFQAILVEKEGSELYRPTLYDFLAHRAVGFFMNDEPSLSQPATKFEVDRPDYFAPATEFAKIQLITQDNLSLKYHALLILQDLVSFHLNDGDPSALVDVDLKRLGFVYQNAYALADKDKLYETALEQLLLKYAAIPVSTDVSFRLAGLLNEQGEKYNPLASEKYKWEKKKAYDLCKKAVETFPDTDGAKNCKMLMQDIQKPAISLQTEKVYIPDRPILGLLSFKNTGQLYVKVIKTDIRKYRERSKNLRREYLIDVYNNYQTYREWKVDLPDDGDFQQHAAQVNLGEFPKGFYVVLIGTESGFISGKGPLAMSTLTLSNLSYMNHKSWDGNLEFYVLNRENGKAIKGVKASLYRSKYDYNQRKYLESKYKDFTTDANGYINIPNAESGNESYYVEFIHNQDTLYLGSAFYSYYYPRTEKPKTITYFFTDRAIYRPGQTIYFKGIMLEKNKARHKILPGEKTKVNFYDVNGQLISSQDLKTNTYGSFHGSFTAPSGVLNGQMRIENASGAVYISVEDYKRPKFEVSYEPLKGTYKLNEEVLITGLANAYAGSAIDHAQVKYRVVREVRFPYLDWWWRGYFHQGESLEITHGVTQTDKDGRFHINFTAIPDLRVDKKYSPVFNYRVYADVTDVSGETHAAETTVKVGYQALLLDLEVGKALNKQNTKALKLTSTNLNGGFVSARVKVQISRLKQPQRVFRKRLWPQPDVFLMDEKEFRDLFPHDVYKDENEPQTWAIDKNAYENTIETRKDFMLALQELSKWQPGTYVVVLSSMDQFGERVETKKYFTLFDPDDEEVPGYSANWFASLKDKAEPGEEVSFVFGSQGKNIYAIYEVLINDTVISRQWMKINGEQRLFRLPVKSNYRGNFGVNIAFISNNRFYQNTKTFVVPYTNKKLTLSLATFRDKLKPGQKEEWQMIISGHEGDKVAAEMMATMYDASLDVFRANNWIFNLYKSYAVDPVWDSRYDFGTNRSYFKKYYDGFLTPVIRSYDELNWFGLAFWGGGYLRGGRIMHKNDVMQAPALADEMMVENQEAVGEEPHDAPSTPPETASVQETQAIAIRSDFRETAFFYPALKTNEKGEVVISFAMPEALTRWKMMGLAYTRDLKIGKMEKEVITQKELMIMPNAPRFFREGDQMFFSAKITSLTDQEIKGEAELHFFDALNMHPLDDQLGNLTPIQPFSVNKGSSETLQWEIHIPEGIEAITYRITAASDHFSDGEEMAIPVLPNRMMVTETLPLPVRGEETRHFQFHKLLQSDKNLTLRNYKLTLEFTSNPAWYAVQALPYLMEFPYECSEQIFSRLYANAMATHIVHSDPQIKKVFDAWKNLTPDALRSNLEKNQELKYLLLEETPWVREAKNETQRKRRIALLFDLNKMSYELQNAVLKLQQLQSPNGGWPWFEGMPDNRFITQHIMTGMGRLQNLGIHDFKSNPMIWNMLTKAISYLDNRVRDDYERLKKEYPDRMDRDHLHSYQIQYLYARSYFMEDLDISAGTREAFHYYRNQADKYWLNKNLNMQGMIGLALYRLGNISTPDDIIKSLKEKAHHDDELGMYWRVENKGYWFEAPVERQALMIELFEEVANDSKTVEELKIWLLKQKQTQSWSTTKSTVDAVYALLLQGADLLSNDEQVNISLGGYLVDPSARDDVAIEAGTGYFQTSWTGAEIKPEMGKVEVTKVDKGIAWGALYWQYFENLDKVTQHQTSLGLSKDLFIERYTEHGPVIEPIVAGNKLQVGDKVIVRIILSSDRDMEFIHLKDMRAAAFEPLDVLSGYHWQGGLGYYQSTRDASTNFFIDYLPKGTYVLEYPLFVSQEGDFSNGISTVQCMYAPEFASHSEGIRVEVE